MFNFKKHKTAIIVSGLVLAAGITTLVIWKKKNTAKTMATAKVGDIPALEKEYTDIMSYLNNLTSIRLTQAGGSDIQKKQARKLEIEAIATGLGYKITLQGSVYKFTK